MDVSVDGAGTLPLDAAAIREIGDRLPEIFFVLSEHGRVEYVNDLWRVRVGLAPGVAVEDAWTEVVHPEDLPPLLAYLARTLVAREAIEFEARVRVADGTYHRFLSRALPAVEGETVRWYGIATDVEGERGRRELIVTLADTIPHLAWLADAEGKPEYYNRRYLEFTGLSADEAADSDRIRALIHPEDVERVTSGWAEAMRDGHAYDAEFRFRRHDGVFRRMVLHAAPVRDASGTIVHWTGTNTDVEGARTISDAFLALSETIPQLVWVSRRDGFIEHWNRRLVEYAGFAPDPETGVDWKRLVHPADAEAAYVAYAEALEQGQAFEFQYRLRRHDGAYRWFLARAEPQRDAAGTPVRWFGTATDIDVHKRAEEALRFLSDTSDVLAMGMELRPTLDAVASLAVASLVDGIAIFRTTPSGVVPLLVEDRDPVLRDLSREIVRAYPYRERDAVVRVASGGVPTLLRRVDAAMLDATAQDDRHRAMLERLGVVSALVLPLVWRGRTIGSLLLRRRDPPRPFDEEDQRVFSILAKRVAAHMEDERSREGDRRLAQVFQRTALPRSLATIPGVEINAIYEPAEAEAEVGGDWYDAFEITPWRLVVTVGDVAGKGIDAAVVMSTLRQGVRFACQRTHDPADILKILDEGLRSEFAETYATATIAVLDVRQSMIRCASAGHPSPLLRFPNGTVRRVVAETAPPLGAWEPSTTAPVGNAALPYGSLVALYTDGILEFSRDVAAGERRVVSTLTDPSILQAANAARFLHDYVLRDERPRDDVAILTLYYGRRSGWSFEAADALAASSARSSFEQWLSLEADPRSSIDGALVIFGELIGNVVRHAPGPIEIRVQWEADDAVLHVFDRGEGFSVEPQLPDDTFAEGGRGLYIASLLGRDLRVRALPGRGSHVRVALPITRRRV